MSNKSIPEFKKTILIGLGGAGKLILTHIKRLLIDHYQIVPPSIKFLSLDTDLVPISIRSDLSETEYSLDEHEFLYLKVDQPIQFIENSSVKKWFIKPLPAGSIAKGAGAIRQIGRVAFFYHLNEFKRRIDNLLTKLNAASLAQDMSNAKLGLGAGSDFKLSAGDTEIYICGSLAGGTGSGTFLDTGIFMRDQVPTALIHGFFLLNWIYRNKPFAYRTPGNVYAALSELDNMLSIKYGEKGFIPYRVAYADKEVQVSTPPFNLVHLVDGRNEYGENIHEVESLCEAIANTIFLSIGTMGDKVASVTDNLLATINVSPPKLWEGKFARYSSFGISSLYYPARELHRLISKDNAVKFCELALLQAQDVAADPNAGLQILNTIQSDVELFFGPDRLNLKDRAFVQDKLSPLESPIVFPLQPFHIADKGFPAMIDHLMKQEQQNLENRLAENHKEKGTVFAQGILDALNVKISDIQKNPALDRAYLDKWLENALIVLTDLYNQTLKDINAATTNLKNQEDNSKNLRTLAAGFRYIPGLGGGRKSATMSWSAAIVACLATLKDLARLEYEKKFLDTLIKHLNSKRPDSLPTPSAVIAALKDALGRLRKLAHEEAESFKILKNKPNQVIIGFGHIVVYPDKSQTPSSIDSIYLDYDQFKNDCGIQNLGKYLDLYQKNPTQLVSLFMDYCENKLSELKNVTVQGAMETIGAYQNRPKEYFKEQFSHLFRLSSALWSFNKGRLSEKQQIQYDKIINIGVFEQSEGRQNYDQFVQEAKGRYHIHADHSFSSTGDPYRLWLLNFAGAQPAYFLSDLEQSKRKYLEQITPTYHIDSEFEMNIPDLYPAVDIANKALRVLGMAIVPGIDLIKDEKLPKGHKFTFNDPAFIQKKNNGEPFVWLLFKDMYDSVINYFNPNEEEPLDNLLSTLIQLLKEKVKGMGKDELRKLLTQYVRKVEEKLEQRDFTRLISARMTYHEIKELKKFLDPRGYGMDIEKYVDGRL